MPDFLPSREADLVTWSLNYKTRLIAAPTAVGVTAPQASAYGALHDAFVTAYNAANNDGTRTRAAIITKDTAKTALIANARLLAGIIQKYPATTNTQRAELGLTVRDADPTPVPPPAAAPGLTVISVDGRTVKFRLFDPANPTRKAKPAGVRGATVMSYVGETAPADPGAWKFEGSLTGRTEAEVVFPLTVAAGAKVFLTAFWFNPRSESGPACAPVSTYLQFGGDMPMAA